MEATFSSKGFKGKGSSFKGKGFKGKGKGKGKGKDKGGAKGKYGTSGFGTLARRTVDYNASCVAYLDKILDEEVQPAPLPAHYSYIKDMKPAFMSRGPYHYDSTCCHLVYTCVPRQARAAVTAGIWQPDGKRYVTGNNTGELTMWDGTQFTQVMNMQGHMTSIRAMTWFRQQNIMMSGDAQGQVKVWDNQFVSFHTMQTHKESIRDLAVAPQSLKFATCADESHAKVWDLRTGKEERAFTGHGWDVKSIHWHGTKGLVATGSKDSCIKLWDPRVGEAICTLFAHSNMVTKVRFSSGEGNWLVSGARDHLVKVFDLKTMSLRRTYKNHQKDITALDFHPDVETMFCSASHDGAMYWWDLNYQSALAGFQQAHAGSIWSLNYHPMGHLLASSAHDASSRMWARVRPGDTRPDLFVPGAIADEELTMPRYPHGGATFEPVQSTTAQPHAKVLLHGIYDAKMGQQKGHKLPHIPGALPGVGADAPPDNDATPGDDGDATPGSDATEAPDDDDRGNVDGVLDATMFTVEATPKNAAAQPAGSDFTLDFAAAVAKSSGPTPAATVDPDATPKGDDDDATPKGDATPKPDEDATPAHDEDATAAKFNN